MEVAPPDRVDSTPAMGPLAPGPVAPASEANPAESVGPLSLPTPEPGTLRLVESALLPTGRSIPLSVDRYALEFTISRETHERLRRVQDLLASAVTSADIPEVFDRGLKLLEEALLKRRCSATDHPRASRGSDDPRCVPASVVREVWERDGGQCTYVSDDGHRCEARRWLECDHVVPVARGGKPTADNLRLRCRAHNQFEAEKAFGEGFMRAKRGQAGQMASA